MDHLLSMLVFLPLIGALVVGLLPRRRTGLIKGLAVGLAGIEFALSLQLYLGFEGATPDMQFVERYTWIAAFGVHFHLGIDGLSLFPIILTTLLSPLALIATWKTVKRGVKGFTAAMLMSTGALVGAFASLDLFLFYTCCEVALLALFLLIGIWGWERSRYAALKFALYTLTGNLLLLVAVIYLGNYQRELTGAMDFDLLALYQLAIPVATQRWLFLAFFVSFAIKMSLFPLHTWLPDAQAESPSAVAAVLVGIWLKIGAYGLLRLCLPLFPEAFHYFADYLVILAVTGIIYGSLLAMVQVDLQRLVAYFSTSQMGLVVLGICSLNLQGVQGSMMHMIHHSLSSTALVLMAGMLYQRRRTRLIVRFGGLAHKMPIFPTCFLLAILAAIGMPGSSGFAGGFLILLGSFEAFRVHAVVAMLGIILAAGGLLRLFQRTAWGAPKGADSSKVADLRSREIAVLLPLLRIVDLTTFPFRGVDS